MSEMNGAVDGVFDFLRRVTANNYRPWLAEHKEEYEAARAVFEEMTAKLITRLAQIDDSVAHLGVKDCTYRFYRDTRFSLDKSPYKTHFGAYVNAKGRKAYHGGYYMHIESGHCMLAGGAWCLPSNILKPVRQSIVDEIDEFRSIVEQPLFKQTFPEIGETHLKKLPTGFPKDFAFPQYLRPKDYSVCHLVPDDFFRQTDWLEQSIEVFKIMKPYNDFINYTIDDYE